MRKTTYAKTIKKPVNYAASIRVENPYSAANSGQHGSLVQSYDIATGDYFPDRTVYPTILGLHITEQDENTDGGSSEVALGTGNSVTWYWESGGEVHPVTTTAANGFQAVGQQLKVTRNMAKADGDITVRCEATFTDATGGAHTVTKETRLEFER